MLYPVYIHIGDERHAHGMIFPDFPGCFSAADDWQEIPALAQEAVECHRAGEARPTPTPTPLEQLVTHPDYQSGGVWMLIDIDTSHATSPQHVNISLPGTLLAEIDAYTHAHGASRSDFLAEAARNALR